jgi:hypothetical protein
MNFALLAITTANQEDPWNALIQAVMNIELPQNLPGSPKGPEKLVQTKSLLCMYLSLMKRRKKGWTAMLWMPVEKH